MKKKRMVILADLHSGHKYGLTPPSKWGTPASSEGKFQRALWKFYTKEIAALRPIDILVLNGDAIEGHGEKSGGVELITADIEEQVKMVGEAIDYAKAKAVRLMFGTGYHTGREVDFEKFIVAPLKAKGVDAKIDGHGFFKVNGVGFDCKHKVGSSSIPHGRFTALAREKLWNTLWNADDDRQPIADVLIRSHVHYYGYCGIGAWLAITTPALTYHSNYGIRDCSGIVNVGFLKFDVDPGGHYSWEPILADFPQLKVLAESL